MFYCLIGVLIFGIILVKEIGGIAKDAISEREKTKNKGFHEYISATL